MSKQPAGSAPKKWEPSGRGRGAAHPPPHASPLTPAHPGGFEDAAISSFAHRHSAAPPGAAAASATDTSPTASAFYERQEGSDSLSNLFHNNLDEDATYILEGEKKIEECRTPQQFHQALMQNVKRMK
jgi:hypothetical protein